MSERRKGERNVLGSAESPYSKGLMARALTHVEWIGLPNLVSGRAVVPELIQGAVTGARLAAEAVRLLEDPVAATAQRAAFKEVRARLGEPGVGHRAAQAVLATAQAG